MEKLLCCGLVVAVTLALGMEILAPQGEAGDFAAARVACPDDAVRRTVEFQRLICVEHEQRCRCSPHH